MASLLDEKVKAQSLVDVVAERIESAIVSGALEPGSRLSEQALAASLGVSRGPLREAIRRLEGRKLLQRIPNIGVRVAELSLKDLNEILQIREALEGMAAALAAQNMTDAEIAGLRQLLEKHGQQKSVQEGKGYYQESKDFDFHFRIVTGARNARMSEMLMGDLYYLLRIYRYKSSTKPGRAKKALQEHEDIVAAIASRDPVLAEQKMRVHLRNARQFVEEQLSAEAAAPASVVRAEPPRGRVRELEPRTAIRGRR
jgi:DNA-binding GntR family transcriptional regulator